MKISRYLALLVKCLLFQYFFMAGHWAKKKTMSDLVVRLTGVIFARSTTKVTRHILDPPPAYFTSCRLHQARCALGKKEKKELSLLGCLRMKRSKLQVNLRVFYHPWRCHLQEIAFAHGGPQPAIWFVDVAVLTTNFFMSFSGATEGILLNVL